MAVSTEVKSERNIQALILMALSEAGCLVWRQDTGAYKDAKTGRLIRYGLCKGSSDVVGVCPDGKALFVEVKTATGRVSPEQTQFLAAVKAKGARSGVARSVKDALDIARGAV